MYQRTYYCNYTYVRVLSDGCRTGLHPLWETLHHPSFSPTAIFMRVLQALMSRAGWIAP